MFKSVIVAVVIVLICVAIFIGTYLLNKNTKKPEGCENLEENCSGCTLVGCSHHPANNEEEKGEQNE